MNKILTILLLAITIMFSSCGEDKKYDSLVGYDQAMKDYMSDKGWTHSGFVDGMYIVIDEEGGEVKPTATQKLKVNYKGYYTDDTVFDENNNVEFTLSQVIEGWQLGMPFFGEGGHGHLLIPPYLAYGEDGGGRTREQSVLVFDVEIVSF